MARSSARRQDPKNVQEASTEQSDADFLEWLEKILIPDLHQSGQEALVEDFESLIDMVRDRDERLLGGDGRA
jgi:hypothetical protein